MHPAFPTLVVLFRICEFPVDSIIWMLRSVTFREISVRGGREGA